LRVLQRAEDNEAAKAKRASKPTKPAGGNIMRRFMVHLVTEIEFEDGDEASDKTVQNYEKHLSETVRNAAHGLSLRTIKGARLSSSNPRA
jgi:hypothetical protein